MQQHTELNVSLCGEEFVARIEHCWGGSPYAPAIVEAFKEDVLRLRSLGHTIDFSIDPFASGTFAQARPGTITMLINHWRRRPEVQRRLRRGDLRIVRHYARSSDRKSYRTKATRRTRGGK